MAIEFAGADDVDPARDDELKPVPVFNYLRAFVTPTIAEIALKMMKNAAANARRGIPVGGRVPEWVDNKNSEVLPKNRLGTTAEVAEYCTRIIELPEENSNSISFQTTDTTCEPSGGGFVTPSRWAPGIRRRVVVASLLALGL